MIMRLGIIGAAALAVGVWALAYWWWFAVEVVQGLVVLGLIIGGALAVTIAIRRKYKASEQ